MMLDKTHEENGSEREDNKHRRHVTNELVTNLCEATLTITQPLA